jgi:hypothetical protein
MCPPPLSVIYAAKLHMSHSAYRQLWLYRHAVQGTKQVQCCQICDYIPVRTVNNQVGQNNRSSISMAEH